jgi:hypothetical protein
MAQVMVNFRLDESVKKNMEQACKEMGMSMTCLLYTSDAADDHRGVDLGGGRGI